MKNKNEFVGVDEKYIPGESSYSDRYPSYSDERLSGVRGFVESGADEYNAFISDEKNQRKIKRGIKSTFKLMNMIRIIVMVGIVLMPILIIGVGIFAFVTMRKNFNEGKDRIEQGHNVEVVEDANHSDNEIIQNDANPNDDFSGNTDEQEGGKEDYQLEGDINMFNSSYEFYEGTSNGNSVSFMLGNLAKDGNNGEHIITVTYGEMTTTDAGEITRISGLFDPFTDYQVELGYDEVGYVNSIVISD